MLPELQNMSGFRYNSSAGSEPATGTPANVTRNHDLEQQYIFCSGMLRTAL